MSDRAFLDSNVIVYSYSSSETQKQQIARKLIAENNTFISTQVLQELCNIITRKFKFNYSPTIAAIEKCCQNNNVHINSETTIIQACKLAERYNYSFYDSLIISAAIESSCSVLYSEDLQNGQILDGKLTVKNPFS
ncbi:MAG: PIN domain-containing protein [Mucilaginibacter sp.]